MSVIRSTLLFVGLALLGAASACGNGGVPSGLAHAGGPAIRLIGLEPAVQGAAPPGQTPNLLVVAIPPTAQNIRLFENLGGTGFADTGLSPSRSLSNAVIFQVPQSGGTAEYYVTADFGARTGVRSNVLTAGGPLQAGGVTITSPLPGALGVSRTPAISWNPVRNVQSYLIVLGGDYVLEVWDPQTSWTVRNDGPVFYQDSGAPLAPGATYSLDIYAIDGSAWAFTVSTGGGFVTN